MRLMQRFAALERERQEAEAAGLDVRQMRQDKARSAREEREEACDVCRAQREHAARVKAEYGTVHSLGPSHDGSAGCRMRQFGRAGASIASGGDKAHCACAACW